MGCSWRAWWRRRSTCCAGTPSCTSAARRACWPTPSARSSAVRPTAWSITRIRSGSWPAASPWWWRRWPRARSRPVARVTPPGSCPHSLPGSSALVGAQARCSTSCSARRLTGRTAITLLPWLLAVITLAADAVASLGRGPRLASTSVAVGLALAAALHAVVDLQPVADARLAGRRGNAGDDRGRRGTPPPGTGAARGPHRRRWMFLPVAQ